MPRCARFAPLDLDTYDGDLSVAQVCDLASEAGFVLESRTLHRWIKVGYVPGHHPPQNREWRLTVATTKRLLERLRRTRHAA